MVGVPHEPEWNTDPDNIHELEERKRFRGFESEVRHERSTHDEVYPKTPGAGSVEVGTSGEPFRTESHPPTQRRYAHSKGQEKTSPSVKFSGGQNDDPVVPCGVVPDELVDDVAT